MRRQPLFHEPLFEGARATLHELERRGHLLAVATGKSDRGLASVLEHHALEHLFVSLQTADRHPSKPHPAMLEAAMRETGSAPHETLMVGDTSYDMQMARAARRAPDRRRLGLPSGGRAGAGGRRGDRRALRAAARAGGGAGVKRFYQDVGVDATGGGHRILLDGRPVRTPARQLLVMPNAALAEAVAGEWRAQGETIERAGMGLTRLVSTALDRMPALRGAAIDEALGYALTDLLCYRAAEPVELAARQGAAWQPWLDWLAEAHGARLVVTTAMLPVSQPEEAVARLRAAIEQLDDWRLVGLHGATTALGSLVLGLALLEGEIDAEQALAASLLDELFEIERWGRERRGERRQQVLRRDVAGAAQFLQELDQPRSS